jgi:ribosomal protein S18 acetylase RimI-like enzyme
MKTIRRIGKGEWMLYKRVRLASLQDAPEAFSTTYESACLRSPESWAAQADSSAEGPDRFTFLAFHDEEPVGLAALYRDANGSRQGEIIQVWISPALRGDGLAGELLDFIFNCAKVEGFEKIRAEVMNSNGRALRFYEKHGFIIDDIPPATRTDQSIVLAKNISPFPTR